MRIGEQEGFPNWYSRELPQWSPDGELIVFEFDRSIYRIESGGSNLRVVSEDHRQDDGAYAYSPSMSPDGSTIAYTDFKRNNGDYQWEIVTSALDGSDKQRLTTTDNAWLTNIGPEFSPDGKRIAFLSGGESAPPLGIFIMSSDGSDIRSLAKSVTSSKIVAGQSEFSPQPVSLAWSPDSRKLAFVVREVNLSSERHSYDHILYTVGADDRGITRLGETTSHPGWSPDSNRLAFIRAKGSKTFIYSVSPDGSSITKLYQLQEDIKYRFNNLNGNVAWSPDGNRILFSGEGTVSVVNRDGSDFQELADLREAPERSFASWSPDGTKIAVHNAEYKSNTAYLPIPVLFTMEPDGSDKKLLARYIPNTSYPSLGQVQAAGGGPWPAPRPKPESRSLKPNAPPRWNSNEVPQSTNQPMVVQTSAVLTNPPCHHGPEFACAPRDVSRFDLFSGSARGAAHEHNDASTVEEILQKGLLLMDASPAHLAVRGTPPKDSIGRRHRTGQTHGLPCVDHTKRPRQFCHRPQSQWLVQPLGDTPGRRNRHNRSGRSSRCSGLRWPGREYWLSKGAGNAATFVPQTG